MRASLMLYAPVYKRLLTVVAISAWPMAGVGQVIDAMADEAKVSQTTTTNPIQSAPNEADGPCFSVTSFAPVYYTSHCRLPTIQVLRAIELELGQTQQGYVSLRETDGNPRPGVQPVKLHMGELGGRKIFYASAIQSINRQLVSEINRLGILDVMILPDPKQIDPVTSRDLRAAAETELKLLILVRAVKTIRTVVVAPTALTDAQKINTPQYARIIENSPVQQDDPLSSDLLDRYTYRLNRRAARRVDVCVLPAGTEDEGVNLDYLISESRPWSAFTQISNTGTSQTDPWREHFGFVHNQLTGHDDILTLDYTTTGFESSHAFQGAYEAPVGNLDRVRWKVIGSWDQFTASDLGRSNQQFTGESWSSGADLIFNVYQHDDFFMDLTGGVQWKEITVTNQPVAPLPAVVGRESFFLPHVGLTISQVTERQTTIGLLNYEFNASGIAATSSGGNLEKLGRADGAVNDYHIFSWELAHSFFLEPMLNPQAWARVDADNPANSSDWAQLAHELAISFHGQYSLGDRLIPQTLGVAGGFYSVRGYPESVSAGDSVFIGSMEYRYHIPHSFKPGPSGKFFGEDFRYRPNRTYGSADWDLIFRAFLDAGQTFIENGPGGPTPTLEQDNTLIGTGVGLEFLFKQNFSARVDYGIALHDANTSLTDKRSRVSAGSDRFYFSFTITF